MKVIKFSARSFHWKWFLTRGKVVCKNLLTGRYRRMFGQDGSLKRFQLDIP